MQIAVGFCHEIKDAIQGKWRGCLPFSVYDMEGRWNTRSYFSSLLQSGSCSKRGLFPGLPWLTGCFSTCIWGGSVNACSLSTRLASSSSILALQQNMACVNKLWGTLMIDICLLALFRITAFVSFPSLPNPKIHCLVFPKWLFPLFILWMQRTGSLECGNRCFVLRGACREWENPAPGFRHSYTDACCECLPEKMKGPSWGPQPLALLLAGWIVKS